MPRPDPAPGGDRTLLGIGSMIMATLVFTLLQALVKDLAARGYPTLQLVFFRSLFALLPVLLLIRAQGGWSLLKTSRPRQHFYRCLAGLIAMACYFKAYSLLGMADAVAIGFSAPLFMTLLSIPLLGETVGKHRWTALLVGFAGVLIMVRPGGDLFQPAALIGLAGALCYALAMIAIRGMSRQEHSLTIVFYYSLFGAVVTGGTIPFVFIMPGTWLDGLLLVGLGVLGGVGQFFLTQAFRLAPVAAVAPFDYTAMIWAIALGLILFGEWPSTGVVIGAVVVGISGWYIAHREAIKRAANRLQE